MCPNSVEILEIHRQLKEQVHFVNAQRRNNTFHTLLQVVGTISTPLLVDKCDHSEN